MTQRSIRYNSLLSDGTIEVWRIALAEVVTGRLPDGEEAAASRIQQADAATRWRAGRWVLRRLLGHHCRIMPQDVPLLNGRWGKPYLSAGPSFNVTTAGNEVVVVVRATGDVGVDLQVREVVPADLQEVAAKPLTSAETTEPRARWARMEAVLKCRGQGFSAVVPAELIAALGLSHGVVQVGSHPIWWRDLKHPTGALCLAADAPWQRIVESSLLPD